LNRAGATGSASAVTPENTIHYEYDPAGRIVSESDDYSSVVYVYNNAGQITSTTQSSEDSPTVTLDYQYDSAGRRTQMAATIDGTADFVDDYTYDGLGRVISVSEHGVEGGNAVVEKRVDFTYNDAGQILTIDRYQNGQLAVEAVYSYDAYGRLVGLVYHQGENVLNSYTWTYSGDGSRLCFSITPDGSLSPAAWQPTGGLLPIHDASGVTAALMSGGLSNFDLITSYTSNDGTATYSYDAMGQLTGAQYSGENAQANESYSYDANGNRIGGGYVVGLDNRLLSDGTYRYEYDAEGNRQLRFIDNDQSGTLTAGDAEITEYEWENRNRLTEVKSFADYAAFSGDTPTKVVDYLYDVENRWIGENIDANGDGSIDHQRRFVYDGNQIVLQFDKDGTGNVSNADLSHRYLWQPAAVDQLMADEQISDPQSRGNMIWPLADNLGTVRDLAVCDSQAGEASVLNHRIYDVYGNLKSETNAAVDMIFGFTGLPFDEYSATYRTATRPYEPLSARFIQPDWIVFGGSQTNLYVYCGNDPMNFIDPSGQDRRIIVWLSHTSIEIRDSTTGVTRWLEFSNEGYTDLPPYPHAFVDTFPITPWRKSTPQQDQMLIDLWHALEKDRLAGAGYDWLKPYVNILWNCWTPVLMFFDFGIPRAEPPDIPDAVYYRMGARPPWRVGGIGN
jgi:RHS repeat-associated protein